MPEPWNDRFKKIMRGVHLNDEDVFHCCQLGGLDLNTTVMRGWRRGEDNPRFRRMTEEQFDAFLDGLDRRAKL